MVQENSAPDLPRGVVKAVINFCDEELGGQIDFEDFYKFSKEDQEQTNLVREWYEKYCRHLIPRRSISINDSNERYSLETNFDTTGLSFEIGF